MRPTDLSAYNNQPYHPGGSVFKRVLWYYINNLIFNTGLFPFNWLKVSLLKLFGGKIGFNVTIKPRVNIKYPWLLTISNNTWIGENVWIDNLVMVTIGSNVCISQGAFLQTGSHNYKKTTFDLITGNIVLEDGVWIGCAAIINHSVIMASHSVLTSGSVATKSTEPYFVYQGNPAVKIRPRVIE
ncbi:WcaF family extracellular polysaccharide biosynthesis acetyltransferase [Mucilaginibacter segetis]|uniref:Colanic acid biosynthesis acetyltransferase WcaF n=1 Tax=Mucilaginibacter segetis TaxID=2793071 RepID=A0A934PSF4_9SPHI|nr:WcaF family extracellular polysaccharide biosynthesis acetyltransferase [Mucilaginibacter segetis]MBK0378185.1 colanic acid biosynthesis acetyltransferase WcaF [Mucilaginibacter segetis]